MEAASSLMIASTQPSSSLACLFISFRTSTKASTIISDAVTPAHRRRMLQPPFWEAINQFVTNRRPLYNVTVRSTRFQKKTTLSWNKLCERHFVWWNHSQAATAMWGSPTLFRVGATCSETESRLGRSLKCGAVTVKDRIHDWHRRPVCRALLNTQ
jgi:hypothetical protein